MRAASASTRITDPYRAGVVLGESLAELQPEVVFLFSSIHEAVPELLSGFYDGLEHDSTIVVGNTGDGCFETGGVSDFGAAALALASQGKVRWRLERIDGLQDTIEGKLERLIERLQEEDGEPCWAYLASDFRVDVSRVEAIVRSRSQFPIAGGLAMDDRRGMNCFLYVNREIVNDALIVLAAYGDLDFSIVLGNSQRPVGRPGHIDDAALNQIHRIDGIGASDFFERETGKPVLQTDRGILSVRLVDPGHPGEERLRSIMVKEPVNAGSMSFFGGVTAGDSIQVCQASQEIMIAELQTLAETLRDTQRIPAGVLVISCTGRKAFLGALIENEVSALRNVFSPELPLAGFASRGEIAPRHTDSGYTHNLFHNMTYVAVVFWQ